MRKEISQERLLELLSYDELTGSFVRNVTRGGQKKGVVAGSFDKDGYWVIRVDGYLYYGHHLAWLAFYGVMPKEIDHKNGNKSDNRILNLREASHSMNMGNVVRMLRGSMQGVHHDKRSGKYQARFTTNGKTFHLGMYNTAEDAAFAYRAAKINLDPECRIAQGL